MGRAIQARREGMGRWLCGDMDTDGEAETCDARVKLRNLESSCCLGMAVFIFCNLWPGGLCYQPVTVSM